MMDENIPAIKSRGRREGNGNKGNLIFVVLAVSKGILSCRTYNDSNLFHRLEATVKDTSERRAQTECVLSIRSIAMVITNSWRKILGDAARVRQRCAQKYVEGAVG